MWYNMVQTHNKGLIYVKIAIYGAGGHAKVACDIFKINNVEVVGFIDGNSVGHGTMVMGLPVLGGEEVFPQLKEQGVTGIFIAIGNNKVRVMIAEKSREAGFEIVNAIHPTAIISPYASIGNGVMIASGAIVCTEVKIGNHVIINTGASVDHECNIEEGSHICPGVRLAGRVEIGKCTQVGIGSSVIQGITIGEHATIGAGSVVVRNIPSYVTAFGCPARVKTVV